MLTSSALVLFMTAPGLAMFYGGLVRKKNVLSVMMQCLYLMCLNTVLWGLYGYSLSFGGNDSATIGSKSNLYIGNTDYLFMRNVERTWDDTANARRAKFYRLTRTGRGRLEAETTDWARRAGAIARILAAEG